MPVSATTLARSIDGADVPMPKVLSVQHLSRIGGGLLFAATSNAPRATVLARGWNRTQDVVIEKNGWAVVSLMALR